MKIRNLETGTSPLIVHAPGWTISELSRDKEAHSRINPLWPSLLRAWKSSPAAKAAVINEITIITWNSKDRKSLLEESLEKLGIPCIVLRRVGNEKWRNVYKMDMLKDALVSVKTPFVMCLDAFDVIVLREPGEAVRKFKMMDCDMLFNGESIFYPDCGFNGQTKKEYITSEWKEFEASVSKDQWSYLNTGAFIAKTVFLKEYVQEFFRRDVDVLIKNAQLPFKMPWMHQSLIDSDQVIAHWILKDFYPRVKVDTRTEIFINVVGLSKHRPMVVWSKNLLGLSIPLGLIALLRHIENKAIAAYKMLRYEELLKGMRKYFE